MKKRLKICHDLKFVITHLKCNQSFIESTTQKIVIDAYGAEWTTGYQVSILLLNGDYMVIDE